MSGILYLCATPIGNLGDITQRVLETLEAVDIIAAEDTRNSIKLLNHFDIHTKLTSYHEYNKVTKADSLVQQLLEGKNVALVTDAGTPGISDPGEVLVSKCHEAGIRVTSLPGPAALIVALTSSGLPARRFSFEAFLPREKKPRKEILEELKQDTRTIIIYEAPHHLKETLEDLLESLGNRRIALCRELTKKFENISRTTLEEALENIETEPPRGEYVLCIEGLPQDTKKRLGQMEFEKLTLRQHMDIYLQQGMDKKEAMRQVATDRGISKRDVYQLLLQTDD